MEIAKYISLIFGDMPALKKYQAPWDIVSNIETILNDLIKELSSEEYEINDGVAIHKTARIDTKATIKGPAILGKNCLVGPYTFLRGGVFLGENSIIGFCSEV